MNKLYKTLLIVFGVLIILILLAIAFISPITKYLVEKYDEKYSGRKITLGWAYVNPFTGYVRLNNLKIHEQKSDSVFFSAESVSANIALLKLLSKTYEISELTLNHPRGTIIQKKKDLNFDDLVTLFSSKEDSATIKAPVHFNLQHVKINDGEFYYQEELIPINYFIKKVNIESTGKQWDADTIALQFSLLSGSGSGEVKGNITINLKNRNYSFATIVHNFDLQIIDQYLNDLSNYGSFTAHLDADVKAKGNLDNQENITASGMLAINDFHFGKNPKDDYASFDKLVLAINELSPLNHKYLFDSVSLSHPYFKYERYDYLDNMQTMFGKNGAKLADANANVNKFNLVIEIANYIKVLSRNFFQSYYHINRLAIYKGELKFNDYSISEKFTAELNLLSVFADSIDKNHKRVNASFQSGIKPYGNVSVSLSINPKDSGDFDMQYHLQKLPLSMFNPYTITYTSFPLDRGTLEINGSWNVRNSIIKSENHLIIIDPRVSKRLRNKDTKWLPLPLVMTFIRERGNVIDYEIPITGNLKDPKFHLKDVIFDVLENIFVKPPTTPYILQVKNIESEIEKFFSLKWEMRHNSIRPNQERFLEKMADFLVNSPDASIVVHPQQYEIKEKELILLFEAKKKYFLMTGTKNAQFLSEEDSIKVDKMSIKDSLFVRYLNEKVNDSMLFTVQEKCGRIIHSDVINSKFDQLNSERKNAFISYFIKREVEKRVAFSPAEKVIPYNGFSFYKIDYKGELPESVSKAYQKMNEINDEAPRKKFKKERNKNKEVL